MIVVLLAVAGFFLWRYFNTYESTDDAQIDGHIDAISARISGHVAEVLAEDERYVKAGDVLVRIDPRDYEVALAKAEADLADAEAALESSRIDIPITTTNTSSQLKTATSGRADATAFLLGAERQLNAAQARLETARAQVREAEANLTKASDDVRRYKLLVDKDEIPRQQYDTAVSVAAARPSRAGCAQGGSPRSRTEHRGGAELWSIRPEQRITSGGRIHRIGPDRAETGCGERNARQVRSGAGRAEEGSGRAGQAEPQLLHDHRARHRHRGQENRGNWARTFRPASS